MIKVTIVVPTIGRPQFLPATLACVLAQDYPHIEILISDNAAQPAILMPNAAMVTFGKTLRLVRREQRMPFAEHFNQCLSEAQGDLVIFVSDDDLIHPGLITAAVDIFSANSSMSLLLPTQEVIGESYVGSCESSLTSTVMPGPELLRRWLLREYPRMKTVIPMMGRRLDMLKAGGFATYPSGGHSDTALFIRMCCVGGDVALLDGGYLYRVYSTSTGLSMPWLDLLNSTQMYEKDMMPILCAHQGRGASLARRLHVSNIRLLISRWWKINRKQSGAWSRLRQFFQIIKFSYRYTN